MKRFKSEESSFREEMALGAGPGGDLYAGHDHTKLGAMLDHTPLDVKQERHDHNVSVALALALALTTHHPHDHMCGTAYFLANFGAAAYANDSRLCR